MRAASEGEPEGHEEPLALALLRLAYRVHPLLEGLVCDCCLQLAAVKRHDGRACHLQATPRDVHAR